MVVGAAYEHDPYIIVELLITIAKEHKKVLEYPPVKAFVIDFAESSINYKVLFWVANPSIPLKLAVIFAEQSGNNLNKKESPFRSRNVRSIQWNGHPVFNKACIQLEAEV